MRENRTENLLEVLLTDVECHDDESEAIKGVVIGKLVDFTPTGEPLVDFSPSPSNSPLPAKSTVVLGKETLGSEVLLLFEATNVRKPIIIGVVQPTKFPDEKVKDVTAGQQLAASIVECDGEKVVFSAEKEIVLRCGDASITLTRAGKILIRGKYLLSRSAGVNRIKGGSVQIN